MKTCSNCGTTNKDIANFCGACGLPLPAAAAPNRLQAGQVLNSRYTVARPLSKGGMGAIYLVEDGSTFGKQRVLKEMLDYVDPADYSDQAAYQRAVQHAHLRFEEEARTLASLKHRGIPDIMDYFSDGGRNYIVMEHVEGVDLEQRLTRSDDQGRRIAGQPYPSDEVIRIGVQVCKVLEYLASLPRPVVHQDIKPANLIVDRSGEVRLVDFGTAKARLAVQPGGKVGLQKSSIYGTVGYAPSEQYSGQSEPRSDVYALAVTLYHLATDDDPRGHPFNFPRLSSLPQGLWRALDPALQQDVARRPTAGQLRARLEALLAPHGAAEPIHLRSGGVARNVAELAAACDQHWEDGKYHLYRGDFEERLRKWGRADLETKAAAIRQQHSNQDLGLDVFLRLLDPAYPPSHLQVAPAALDLGVVPWGEQRSVAVEVLNSGHGALQADTAQRPPWLSASPLPVVVHDRHSIQMTVDAGKITPQGQAQSGQLLLDGGLGGQAQVIVKVVVPEPRVVVSPAALNLGAAYQGETRRGQITVSNQGGSPCEVVVASNPGWAKAAPERFPCQPGQSVSVAIEADTSQMRLGPHQTRLAVTAEAGGWRQETPLSVAVELPKLKNFAYRYRAPLTVLSAVVVVVLALAGLELSRQITYSRGQALLAAGQWDQAIAAFERLDAYRDAPAQLLETHYQAGLAYQAAEQWEQAAAAFERAGSHRDASTQILETHYQAGLAYQAAEQWEQAVRAFMLAGSHHDASVQLQELYDQGRPIRSLQDDMELVYVPAGEFLMGSTDADAMAQSDEKPQHTVYLDAFWIDKTEVTAAQYRRCVEAGVCSALRTGSPCTFSADDKSDHPINCVGWSQAVAYCGWAGRRLPSEAEWERAARGADGRIFPWGDQAPDATLANFARNVGSTTVVGSFPAGASPYGALDMAGNVREWVADWYDATTYTTSPRENPQGPASGSFRVLRGGSWVDAANGVRAAYRNRGTPGNRLDYVGFRCARSP